MLPCKVTYSVTERWRGSEDHVPASYNSDNGNSTTVICRVPGFCGGGGGGGGWVNLVEEPQRRTLIDQPLEVLRRTSQLGA